MESGAGGGVAIGCVRVQIREAGITDLEAVVPLFDAYRQFYRQTTDQEGARRFLRDRIANAESVILLASADSAVVGFAQMYPLFSSGAMARIFVLNDLFVADGWRRAGVGSTLLAAACECGRRAGAVRLTLSTELTNATAQAVYEKAGWKRNAMYCTYNMTL